jgi:hypothetical protein
MQIGGNYTDLWNNPKVKTKPGEGVHTYAQISLFFFMCIGWILWDIIQSFLHCSSTGKIVPVVN